MTLSPGKIAIPWIAELVFVNAHPRKATQAQIVRTIARDEDVVYPVYMEDITCPRVDTNFIFEC